MYPAHPTSPHSCLDRVDEVLHQQGALLVSVSSQIRQVAAAQDQILGLLAAQVQQLTASLAQVSTQPPPDLAPPAQAPASVSPVSEPRVGAPERYAGEPENSNPFLANCSILFALQPHTFASEEARVAFAINHLTGKARLWGTAGNGIVALKPAHLFSLLD